jgi:hypothetical protein
MGVEIDELVDTYPRLYHLTHLDNWPLIRQLGLLSTSALLDLFEIDGDERRAVESCNRRDLVPIRSAAHGLAILRDQKPMDDRGLARALTDGITPTEWYRLVNRHVFFWVDRRRVDRLLGARAYRNGRHALLVVRTRDLLDRHSDQVVLSPLNTGATKPMPHPRGRDCFVRPAAYPFAQLVQRRSRRDAVVELAIPTAVPDLLYALERVLEVGRGNPEVDVWPDDRRAVAP